MRWRKTFQKRLEKEGLVVEISTGNETDKDYQFMKLHCTWGTLTKWAEILSLNMPIAYRNKRFENTVIYSFLTSCFKQEQHDFPKLPKFLCAPFCRNREEQFLVQDRDIFFSPSRRSLIAYNIFSRAVFEHFEVNSYTNSIRKAILSFFHS